MKNNLIASKGFRVVAVLLSGLFLILVGFSLGVSVGERKERHFENRNANFPGMFVPRPGMMARGPIPIGEPPLAPAHGAFGKVISVAWPSVVIEGRDQTEQEILATTSTQIRIGRTAGHSEDVKPGIDVGIFGNPNANGQIEATLIRISASVGGE